jgi:hypothetical protein
VGRFSYWMDDLESVTTVDDAARMLDSEDFGISIDHLEDVWAVCDNGRPQFWRDTRAEAEEAAKSSSHWTVEHFESIWRVCIGDQYIFTTPDRSEAEGFVFGMAAHMYFRNQNDHPT